jgi:hypothetical protein
MFKKLALLAAALTLTMPVFAQGTTTSGSTAAPATSTMTDAKPVKAKKHHAAKHSHKKAKEADAPKN